MWNSKGNFSFLILLTLCCSADGRKCGSCDVLTLRFGFAVCHYLCDELKPEHLYLAEKEESFTMTDRDGH